MPPMQILMVTAPRDFRDEELLEPKAIFDDAAAEVTVSSRGTTEATGKLGAHVKINKDLSKVGAADYDALVFVGGPGAATYFNDPTALKLIKRANADGKILAAICIAPSILANSGILEGKRATAFASEEENLRSKGAIYTGEPVTRDGSIITANGPDAAEKFGKTIIAALKERR